MKGWLPQLSLTAGAALLAGWVLAPLWLTVLLGVALYLLLDPLVGRLQAGGTPRVRAILLALSPPLLLMAQATAQLVTVLRTWLPSLPADVEHLQRSAALALLQFELWLEQMIGVRLQLAPAGVPDLNALLQTDRLIESGGTLANLLINIALAPPLAFFLLRDFRQWRDRMLSLLPNPQFELGWLMYYRVSTRMERYLQGLLLQALILAGITAFGFWLAGFRSPVLLGALTGVAGVVPYLGPFLAMIAPMVMLLSEPVFHAEGVLQMLAVLSVGFGFDNLVTLPFVLAGTVNLHPGLAMLAVVVAGHVGGIPAMVLVIPLLGMLKIVAQSLLHGLNPVIAGTPRP